LTCCSPSFFLKTTNKNRADVQYPDSSQIIFTRNELLYAKTIQTAIRVITDTTTIYISKVFHDPFPFAVTLSNSILLLYLQIATDIISENFQLLPYEKNPSLPGFFMHSYF